MNKKSKIIVSIAGITIVLLALLGITYAYYLTRIEGNTNTNSISVTTADLKLEYGDGTGPNAGLIEANDLMPGDDITKEFTVTNKGESKVDDYVVVLENVVNELTRPQDLTYTLSCVLSDGSSCGEIELVDDKGQEFPDDGVDKAIFLNSIDIGVTHYYTLVVSYANPNEDQSDDMGKTFSALVNIKDKTEIDTTGLSNPNKRILLATEIINNVKANKNGTIYSETPLTEPVKEELYQETEMVSGSEQGTFTPVVGKWYGYGDYVEDQGGYYLIKNANVKQFTGDLSFLDKKYVAGSYQGYDAESDARYQILGRELGDVYYLKVNDSSINYIGGYSNSNDVQYAVTFKESSLSKTEDIYGPSYYYRGGVEDNYVLFNNMCFRIVRIEGDGSIKLALAGEVSASAIDCSEVNENSSYLRNSSNSIIYNSGGNNYADVKQTYLSGFDSVLSTWFNNKFSDSNLLLKIKNDRWCLGGNINYNYNDNGLLIENFVDGHFNYSSYIRINNLKTTSLMCENEDYIDSQYGMLSIDEIGLAGFKNSYLNVEASTHPNDIKGSYWTMSIATADDILTHYFYTSAEYPSRIGGGNILPLRPAITLVKETLYAKGDGTKLNPYVIK